MQNRSTRTEHQLEDEEEPTSSSATRLQLPGELHDLSRWSIAEVDDSPARQPSVDEGLVQDLPRRILLHAMCISSDMLPKIRKLTLGLTVTGGSCGRGFANRIVGRASIRPCGSMGR